MYYYKLLDKCFAIDDKCTDLHTWFTYEGTHTWFTYLAVLLEILYKKADKRRLNFILIRLNLIFEILILYSGRPNDPFRLHYM